MEQVSDVSRTLETPSGSVLADRFSLLRCCPLYRLPSFTRREPPRPWRVIHKILLAIVLTWIPLLVFSAMQGQATGSRVRIPFLYDYAVNIRFLITLPLLILAEAIIDPRLRKAAKSFVISGLVAAPELPTFESAIRKTNRLRDGWLPAILLLAAVFAPSFLYRGMDLSGSGVSSWHTIQLPAGDVLSWAGWWFALISLPVYRLLLYGWVWIILMWAIFLARVGRLQLNCVATHPDKAGGLGFLARTQRFFGLIAFAGSAVVAGNLANQLAYQGASLSGLRFLMVASSVLILIVTAAPLLVLTFKLLSIQERGLSDYSRLGEAYVQEFQSKWIRDNPPGPLLGSADIQSLADLANSFWVVRDMKCVLLDKETLLILAVPTLFPMVVLLLAVSPTEEVVHAILKMLA
jgi:hypothetical protein